MDVWFSRTFPVSGRGEDWRRVRVAAPDATSAELIACQVVARHGTPVASVVIDWPPDQRNIT